MESKLLKIESKVIKIEKALLAGLIIFMVFMSFLQVVLRISIGKSILWLDPMLRYLVLWAGFLGASLAIVNNKHFMLDVITRNLKPETAKLINKTITIFIILICLMLMFASVKFVKTETIFDTKLFSIGSLQVSALYMEFMIPLGFALMIFHSITRFFDLGKFEK